MDKHKSPYSSYERIVGGTVSEGKVSFSLKSSHFSSVMVQTICDRDHPFKDYHSSLVVVEVMGNEGSHCGVM